MRMKVFAVALVAIVLSGVGIGYGLFHLRTQAMQTGERLTASFAHMVAVQTTHSLQSLDLGLQLTNTALQQAHTQGNPSEEQIAETLLSSSRQLPFFFKLEFVDTRKGQRYTADQGAKVTLQRDTGQQLPTLTESGIRLIAPSKGSATDPWVLSIARPVGRGAGEALQGVLVGYINPEYFNALWDRIDLGQQSSVSLFSSDGQLVMRSPFDIRAMGQNFGDRPLFAKYLREKPNGTFHSISPIDNIPRLLAYQTVADYPQWVAVVGMSYALLLDPWTRLAITSVSIWAVASVVILVLCYLLQHALLLKIASTTGMQNMAQRFAMSTDAAGVGVWDWQLKTDTWFASSTYYTMLGYADEQGAGNREQWLARVHPEDRELVAQKIRTSLTSESAAYQYEARIQHANGDYRWVHVLGRVLERSDTGKPQRLMGVRIDITDRKNTEEALRRSESFSLAILDSVAAEIAVLDPQGLIVAVNAPWRKFALENAAQAGQIPAKTQTGNNYLHACQTSPHSPVAQEGQQASEGISAVLQGLQDSFSMEYACHTATQERWFNMSVTPLGTHGDGAVVTHIDITERKSQQTLLKLSEQVFAQSLEGIMVTNAKGRVVIVNHAFTDISGFTLEEVLGKHPRSLASKRHDDSFHQAITEAVVNHGTWQGEIWSERKDGSDYPQWLKVSVVRDAMGKVCNFVGTFSDISEQKANQEKINWLSHFDPVTGLPNRFLLQDRATHAISIAQRAGQQVTIMMLALDHFRTINDTFGHATGDHVLQQVAQRLKHAVRDQDTLARMEGKEFVLVLPDTQAGGAAHFATQLLEKVSRPYTVNGQEHALSATMGIAMFPDNGSDFDALIRAAQIAMHRAQSTSRGTFKFYNDDIYRQIKARDQLGKALRSAIALDQLSVVYQPLADLQTGRISGVEALVRWQHPELGSVSPVQFIPIAEESGLIKSIGEWVLRKACSDMQAWQGNGIHVPHVAVNVSPLQFEDADLIAQVQRALTDYQVDPALVYLEVTESALMDDVEKSEAMLKALKVLGVRLSLDDFGTGYSSLSYLKRFPFDKVKIDQSFVRDVGTSRTDVVIVKVIVAMAHGLGLTVIAEGVETESQCEIMRNNVCDEIQGYFFSRPVSATAITELFTQGLALPTELLRFRKPQRTLLLVDDDTNVLASLKRLFRKDGHKLLTASSGAQALETLATHKVDVIVSDQRMPGMTGVEFFRAAKVSHPDTIRIILSGYTELQSVTDAINEGAIYRFLTKPWDDDQLRDHIRKAFEFKELLEENQQLDMKIRTSNQELVSANVQLNDVLARTRHQVARDETTLAVVRDALECIALPIMGLDDKDDIIFVNDAAERLLEFLGPMLGENLRTRFLAFHTVISALDEHEVGTVTINNKEVQLSWSLMGSRSKSRGKIVVFTGGKVTF